MVAQGPLTPLVMVRIHVGQPYFQPVFWALFERLIKNPPEPGGFVLGGFVFELELRPAPS